MGLQVTARNPTDSEFNRLGEGELPAFQQESDMIQLDFVWGFFQKITLAAGEWVIGGKVITEQIQF